MDIKVRNGFYKRLKESCRSFLIDLVCLFLIIIFTLSHFTIGNAQENSNAESARFKAEQLLSQLSPEEKVGQLFLITFKGSTANEESKIYDLIVNHHIGGVVLKRDNDNFIGPENTIQEAFNLITELQNAAALSFFSVEKHLPKDSGEGEKNEFDVNYIPLFIGISQEGDLTPFDQIINGLTPLPDQMAIGATWDIELARSVGETLGKELSSLGINLFLGPSLDVLDINYASGGDDLGTRTFGGDPYWVGQMGRAYIQGLHSASDNKLAVIAKHFPGRGGSDRPPEEEVATVRKSLEQLKLIEFSPFFAVTGNARSKQESTDGLYLSHIRYQGLQGNIRAITKPISLDSTALQFLLSQPELSIWRENGGVIVSDDLGSQAIRRFYDPTGKTFDARQVVRSAFLAGNDLLYMDQILSSEDDDVYATIINLLKYFTQKYQEDRAFSERVDESVERILTLKYQIYPTFDPAYVLANSDLLVDIGKQDKISFDIASKALTLISPEDKELVNALSSPPDSRSNIVFFTDEVITKQCSQCKVQAVLSKSALEDAVFYLYGTGVGGQISRTRLSSYSYTDLNNYLESPINHLELESSLTKAEWIVFIQLNVDSDRIESKVLHRLITEKPELIRLKRIIVFAFNTPYKLDATDISSLTAYYALYSKIPASVEIAARALFQEIDPSGSSPVSIPAIAYDLITTTSPDPKQILKLSIEVDDTTLAPTQVAGVPTSTPIFFLGDVLPLRTGVILDHNGNPVPDGTIVKFLFSLSGEKRISQQVEAVTYEGIARTSFRIQEPGMLAIQITSEPAMNSEILLLDITEGKSIVVSAIIPTINPEPEKLENTTTEFNPDTRFMTSSLNPVVKWMIVIGILWGIGLLMVWIGKQLYTLQWGIRAGLLAVVCGLMPYVWILLNLPGSTYQQISASFGKTILVTCIGASLGIFFYWNANRKRFSG